MTVAAYDVYFLKATVNVHANITQPKNDRECFTAERVSRVPADLAEFFSVSSTRLQESILLKRCFRAVYGLGRDRRADPGYHFTFHLIPVVKCMCVKTLTSTIVALNESASGTPAVDSLNPIARAVSTMPFSPFSSTPCLLFGVYE